MDCFARANGIADVARNAATSLSDSSEVPRSLQTSRRRRPRKAYQRSPFPGHPSPIDPCIMWYREVRAG